MAHGPKVVDLVRLDVGDDGDEVDGVAQVAVVEEQLHARLVPVVVDVVDAPRVEQRRPPDDAMDPWHAAGRVGGARESRAESHTAGRIHSETSARSSAKGRGGVMVVANANAVDLIFEL